MDYYFSKNYNDILDLNEYRVNMPVCFDSSNYYLGENSVFELLFEDAYDSTSYVYSFSLHSNSILDKKIRDRVYIKNTGVLTYLTDIDGTENPVVFSELDLNLLDELCKYKNGIEPDLTIVDNTSDLLNSKLSYYIYYYLDSVINRNTQWLNSIEDISNTFTDSTNDVVADLYEIYVLNKVHTLLSNYTGLIDSSVIHRYPVRNRRKLTNIEVNDAIIILDSPLIDTDSPIRIYRNGTLLDNTLFTITVSGTENIITFDNTVLNLLEDDYFMIDYYSIVDVYEHDTTTEESITYKGEI